MTRPESEEELAEAIRTADGPLALRGGGTRGVAVEGAPLDLSGLSGITLYEPGALTLVARAGTPLAEIEAALAGEGQRLAFEPMDHRGMLGTGGDPTIGGMAAANVSGPRRISVGACRDFMLGVRFVDGSGALVKNGGRVMKNVTGYDLVKLMAGSHGALGVLTEVSLKVLPAPPECAVLLIDGLDVSQAVAAMSAALKSPYEVSGAAHTPKGIDGHPVTMIRIEGFPAQIANRVPRLRALLEAFGPVNVEQDRARTTAGWAWVRDVETFHGKAGDIWRVHCKPSDAAGLAAKAGADEMLLDWGGGLIWLLVPEGHDLRGALGAFDGHATCLRGAAPRFHPQPAALAALQAGLRRQFDPRGILNPGLMG